MSKKLISLKNRIANLPIDDVKIYRKWAHALCMLPFYVLSNTPIKQLEDDVMNISYADPIVSGTAELLYVILILDRKPDSGGDHSFIGCNFMEKNQARIDEKNECHLTRTFPELDAINFFGFTGTWDEVAHKMFVANKILSTRNPFRNVPKM